MTNRPSGKSYVDRADILANEKLAPEVRAILTCIKKIDVKVLPIVVWLVASGETGLNETELKELTGFGLATVLGLTQRLISLGFVKLTPPIFQSESGRYVLDIDELGETPTVSEPIDCHAGKIKKTFSAQKEDTPPSPLTLPSPSSLSLLEILEDSDLRAHAPAHTRVSDLGDSDPDRIEKEKILNPPVKVKKLKVGPLTKPKMKKLKTSSPDSKLVSNGRLEFANDLRAETKQRYKHKVNPGTYVKNPSENPSLTQWKTKHQPNRWRGPDWVGYWLYKWMEYYEQEDPTFVGQRFVKSIKRSKDRSYGRLGIYWETAFKIEAFRDNDCAFRGDGNGLKDYIDWLFEKFLPGADWLDTPITVLQIFKTRNNIFLEKFKVRSVKVKKGKKKKGKGKWRHWGWDPEG